MESKPFEDSESTGSPARRRAEEQVLAMLIYQPELADTVVELNGLESAPFAKIAQACSLFTSTADSVAKGIWTLKSDRTAITVQRLLAALEDDAARQLATFLYFEGERLLESSTLDATDCFEDAVRTLQSHIDLIQLHQSFTEYHACKSSPEEAIAVAQTVLERRRLQGHIPSAIGRGIRS